MSAIPEPVPESGTPTAASSLLGDRREKPSIPLPDGSIEPVQLSFGYRLSTVLVALGMVVLPALYLAIVIASFLATVFYGAAGLAIFTTSLPIWLRLGLYVAPLAGLAITTFFLVKPILARAAAPPDHGIEVTREEEPQLFAIVERVCAIVRAPTPHAIVLDNDINASASRGAGFAAIFRSRLTLRIGLPLLASLQVDQLAGVLAHEFGHFAQGAGMRLSYLIRVTNVWFLRVVYERDSWDVWLRDGLAEGGHWILQLSMLIGSMAVWLSRKLLWLLMRAAQLLSAFISRQMELDADLYEIRLAGSENFSITMRRLRELANANAIAMNEIGKLFERNRTIESYPHLLRWAHGNFTSANYAVINDQILAQKPGIFDTYPTDSQRIARADACSTPGIYRCNEPAWSLLADFSLSCRNVTRRWYEKHLSIATESMETFSFGRFLDERAQDERRAGAVYKYIGPFDGLAVPLTLGDADRNAPDDGARKTEAIAIQELQAILEDLAATAANRAEEAKAYYNKREELVRLRSQYAQLDAGFANASDDHQTAPSKPDLERTIAAHEAEIKEMEPDVAATRDLLVRRLSLVFCIAAMNRGSMDHPSSDKTFIELERWRHRLNWMAALACDLQALQTAHTEGIHVYLALMENAATEEAVRTLQFKAWDAGKHLRHLKNAQKQYQGEHDLVAELPFWKVLENDLPSAEDLGGIMNLSGDVLRTAWEAQSEAVGRVATTAAEFERSLFREQHEAAAFVRLESVETMIQ